MPMLFLGLSPFPGGTERVAEPAVQVGEKHLRVHLEFSFLVGLNTVTAL